MKPRFSMQVMLLFLLFQNPLPVAEQLYTFDNEALESNSYIRRRHRFWNKTFYLFIFFFEKQVHYI